MVGVFKLIYKFYVVRYKSDILLFFFPDCSICLGKKLGKHCFLVVSRQFACLVKVQRVAYSSGDWKVTECEYLCAACAEVVGGQ